MNRRELLLSSFAVSISTAVQNPLPEVIDDFGNAWTRTVKAPIYGGPNLSGLAIAGWVKESGEESWRWFSDEITSVPTSKWVKLPPMYPVRFFEGE